ncbi:hypothetical protein NCCP2222_19550 [Sporosarcina sp. NCCP-2222]|uniref:hypothetical protein n=1 Tax=Sporosarcina sp. NCCP-2222 TaxID=2935073 RepID=UPI0020888CD9|nr:hypothetical protein [Sporosarcina sp. NCCP-2222]GKV56008.1 hypothetical protein NCCP2222_19550 [Sporosarcina sp. NCCP-2222]
MDDQAKKAMFALRDDLKSSLPTNSVIMVNRRDLETVVNHLFHAGDQWSNQSALGYAIAAAESLEMSKIDIQRLVSAIVSEFDWKTLENAADVYRKSDYLKR